MLRSLKLNKNLVIIAASYAIGLTIILALIGYAGVSNVIENIMRKMTYQLFAITFILDITGLIFYALIWHILLLGTGSKVKFKVSLSSTWASIFIMYLSPTGIIVELLKIILTNKEGKVNIGKGMAAFMMQRIIYSISFITIAIVSYLIAQYRYVIIGEMIGRIISALIMIAIATIITLIIIGIKAEKIEEIILRIYEKYQDNINKILSKYDSMEIVNSISSTINEFKNSFQELKNNKTHLITVFILTTANWVLNVTILYVVLLSLGYKASIWIIMLIMVAGEFVQMTPIAIPGMLGILETVMAKSLNIFGVPLDVAVTASIMTRVATFWFDLPVTAVAASYYGIKYLIKGSLKESNKSSTPIH